MTLGQIDWPLILGGLGLFLFGIDYMGNGLKSFAGDGLKDIIDRYTKTPLHGIVVGTVITCLIQSSSGTTALTIGLIRSGLMTFPQAIGVIMGANIGTTITAFIVGLKISEYAVYFIILGAVLIMFSSRKRMKYFGQILFGFGCLFYGLELMGDNLKLISKVPEFTQATELLSANPLLALFGGTVMTMAIQSSSAVIAIVQQMYGVGAITMSISLPFLFGSNIGTTITAVLAAFGGSTSSRRAATYHVIFNVFGTVLFMLILKPFTGLVVNLSQSLNTTPEMSLAMAHGIFNISTTVLMYPLIHTNERLIKKLVKKKSYEVEVDLSTLNEDVVGLFPEASLNLAIEQTGKMGALTCELISSVKSYFDSGVQSKADACQELENAINIMEKKLTVYLANIPHEKFDQHTAIIYINSSKIIKDFELIADLGVRLVSLFEQMKDSNESMHEKTREEIGELLAIAVELVDKTYQVYKDYTYDLAEEVDAGESLLDIKYHEFKDAHVHRVLNKQERTNVINSLYDDAASLIERIGDYCQSVSENVANIKGELV